MARRNSRGGAHFRQEPAPQQRRKSGPNPGAKSAHRQQPKQQPRQQPRPQPKPRRRSKGPIVFVIVVLLLAAAGVGGFIFWQHRPVAVMIDGERRTVLCESSLADIAKGENLTVDPGDYVSVTGKVIKECGGDPYAATVNNNEVSYSQAAGTHVYGGEVIEFTDGDDVMEEHTTETIELQPKLEFKVMPGTAEKGNEVQHGVVQYIKQWGKAGKHEVYHGKESGETSDGKVVEEPQNLIIVAQDIHPDNDEKLVAVTFDDGPTYYTEPCLNILSENGAKATFNIIGEQIADGGPVVKETAEDGHLVASHSWTHPQLTTISAQDVYKELSDTATALKKTVGEDCNYLRPPYGSIDESVWLASKGAITASFYWTHDSCDWERPGTQAIITNSTTAMAPGSVILMHDGGGDRSQTMEALPQIIAAWKAAGYRFVTMEELMASDSSIDLSAVKMGTMPADCVWPTEMA